MSNNAFTGTFPKSVGNWVEIETARFKSNQLVGTMPSDICDAPDLAWLSADCDEVEWSCCTGCS